MLFNSLEFAVFLPIVFGLHWLLCGSARRQNALLVVAGCVFYGWWSVRALALLALVTAASYAGGLLMSRCTSRGARRAVCAVVVTLGLGVLAAFKYFNFFADSLALLFGSRAGWVTLHLVLPAGISFYTFQTLSYAIDVYRGRLAATTDAVAYAAYVAFFPQLVAGPIERAGDLLPQFARLRQFSYPRALAGFRLMLWGLFKKMVVADNCAPVVNRVWADVGGASATSLLVAAVLFAFQIYADFSGYSDIAVGCARLFGIELTRNFRYPYFARDVRDFWRRWHVTLMRWFTDYVYIPLGGSRRSAAATLRNVVVVFALSGLWHGASWTFVAWGLYHALLLIAWRAGRRLSGRRLPAPMAVALTFAAVAAGWVLFRAPSFAAAASFARGVWLNPWGTLPDGTMPAAASVVAMLAVEGYVYAPWRFGLASRQLLPCRPAVMFAAEAVLIMCIATLSGTQSQFIYFRF